MAGRCSGLKLVPATPPMAGAKRSGMAAGRVGWITVLIYLVIIVTAALYLLPEKPEQPSSLSLVTFSLVLLAMTFFAIGISYVKGPVPRWRWGKNEHDNPDEDI